MEDETLKKMVFVAVILAAFGLGFNVCSIFFRSSKEKPKPTIEERLQRLEKKAGIEWNKN